MAVTQFDGKLNANEIFGSLYNMIISQQVFADNIKGTYSGLVAKFKTDGTLYGDTKLFYSTDAIGTEDWLGDNEAQNLLKIHRPADPDVQAVTIDQFRMIPLTVDNYLSKRAYSTEGAFNEVQSVMLGWMRDTKKIYDSTLMNTYVGTTKSEASRKEVSVDVTSAVSGLSGEEKNRVEAQTIAQSIADLVVDLKDVSRDFNDYGHLRSYEESDFLYVWNSAYVNKLTKVDLPTIFNKDGLFNAFENVLPARYFGDVIAKDVALASNDGSYRSTIEAYYATGVGAVPTHVFPGDVIPAKTAKVTQFQESAYSSKYRVTSDKATSKPIVSNNATASAISSGIAAGEAYKVNSNIICKVIHKSAIPFMSAFETATSFFNPRSLTENHYLIWGYSKPQYLYDKPFITVIKK